MDQKTEYEEKILDLQFKIRKAKLSKKVDLLTSFQNEMKKLKSMHEKELFDVMTIHKASIENIHQQSRDEKHRLEQENYQVMEASNERMGKLFSDRESL